jgi:phage-related protein
VALRIGDLVGFLRADDSGMRRGLTEAEMRLAGFQRDANGRLRDLHGHFITESDAIGRAIAAGLGDGSDEGVRLLRTRLRAGIRQAGDDTDRGFRGIWRRLVNRSGQAGDDTGRGLAGRLLSSLGSVLTTGLPQAFNAVLSAAHLPSGLATSNPWVAGVGLALAAAIAAVALPFLAALISGAVIAVGGLTVIGVGAALLKDEPQVKKVAGSLMKTVKGIFSNAAKPLAKPLADALRSLERTAKDVAPQIDKAFRTVAESGIIKDLTEGIDGLVKGALPGFQSMLERSKPVFEGVKEMLSDIGEGLGLFFEQIGMSAPGSKVAFQDLGEFIKGLLFIAGAFFGQLGRIYGTIRDFIGKVIGLFQHLYDVLVGHSIIPDTVNEIIRWFAGLPGRAASVLASLPGKIAGVASSAMRSLGNVISSGIGSAVSYVRGLPGRAVSALSSLGGRIAGVASSAMRSLGNVISRGIGSAISYIRGLPGRARSALGGLSGLLYGAGQSLISGFISGIRSMIDDVRDAASSVVSAARNFFPFSPAKEGPFSGRGYTTYSGRALIEGFQRGIAGQLPSLRATLKNLPGLGVPGFAAAGRGALRAQLHALTREIPGMGLGLSPGRGASGSGGVLRIELAGPEEMKRLIRGIVATHGGDVQLALGNRPRR